MSHIVANWKQFFTHRQAIDWLNAHKDALATVLEQSKQRLTICPSFTVLPARPSMAQVTWGAQNCSLALSGAYTGEISAQSLAQLGCEYTIIGHSERRIYFNETDQQIAQKAQCLIDSSITPIICIGETDKEKSDGLTLTRLRIQLEPIASALKTVSGKKLVIAYEPVWAIGTGTVPHSNDLTQVLSWLRAHCQTIFARNSVEILYGGSVTEHTLVTLKPLGFDGYLIGSASTDIELLKKIILSC